MDERESSLAWLDLDEETRRTMQEHLALLTEPNTVDEFGIGQIRDAFSDIFFPGTSTLWRRARYMLFVPWVYRELERNGTQGVRGAGAARRLQIRLIRALKQGDDHEGLIGRYKDEVVRMPDELVWHGLRAWGIRRRGGSLGRYRRMLEQGDHGRFELVRGQEGEAVDVESGSWWHEALPTRPAGLYDGTNFDLSWDEADFLRSRLEATHHQSLLTELLVDSGSPDLSTDWPWDARHALRRVDAKTREAADHARVFSYAIQGAGIVYSHLVATKRKDGDLASKLVGDLDDWARRLDKKRVIGDITDWGRRRDAFWALIRGENPGLRAGTEKFVDQWTRLVSRGPGDLIDSRDAHDLVRHREWEVKRHLARLTEAAALDQARAESGTDQLSYRWVQARSIAVDICRGLEERLE